MMSVTECAKIFGVSTRTVEGYLSSEGHSIGKGKEMQVDSTTFFRWVIDKQSCSHSIVDLEEFRRNELKSECQKLEIEIAASKALLIPSSGIDDACLLYFKKMKSVFSEDLAVIFSGRDEHIRRGIISEYKLALEACAAYLSNYMTDQGRFCLSRVLRGKA